MPVDRTFLDVDLSVVPDGQSSGLIPQTFAAVKEATSHVGDFERDFPDKMVPRSQWADRIGRISKKLRNDVTRIYSQGNEGSCVGFGSAQMLETTLRRRYGIANWVSLSGMSIYKRIGSSANSGAMISDGMNAVVGKGALPADTPENRAKYQHVHPYTGFSKRLPDGWEETGKLFRGSAFAVASGVDAVMSALLNGFCGIVGRSGHCVPYVLPEEYEAGGFCACYANSWGDWGDEGFGYDSERVLRSIDCYVLLDVVTRPDLGLPTI